MKHTLLQQCILLLRRDDIKSEIKETLMLKNSSHNMLVEKKDIDEYNLIYKTINQFINKFS